MKLQYNIVIHRYPDDKKRKNQTLMGISWRKENDKPVSGEFNYCCSDMAEAFSIGYITTVTDKRNFHIKRDKQSEILKEPVVCLKTFDEVYDYDSGLDEYNLPIKFCPFCAEEIIFELTEKKKITHACKKSQGHTNHVRMKQKKKLFFQKGRKSNNGK